MHLLSQPKACCEALQPQTTQANAKSRQMTMTYCAGGVDLIVSIDVDVATGKTKCKVQLLRAALLHLGSNRHALTVRNLVFGFR